LLPKETIMFVLHCDHCDNELRVFKDLLEAEEAVESDEGCPRCGAIERWLHWLGDPGEAP
jgi:hypothetical protein